MSTSTLKRTFWLFLLFNAVIWSIVPLLRLSLPMDTQEAIVWGKYSLLGTTKHPPFSGWLAYPFWQLFAHWDGALYLLSQLCVALGVAYIWRLARCFLSTHTALLAALLQFGIIYYNFSSVEFNVNVISLALWPMCAFYFWRAYTQNKWTDWLLFGLFAGINLLNKYISGILLMSLALFVLADKGALKLLKNIKVYVAAIICLLVIAPHVWWLYQNNFEMWHYMAQRSSGGKITAWYRHLAYPLKFLAAQLLFCLPALLTYFIFRRRDKMPKPTTDKQNSLFIFITAVAPISIFALIGLISGSTLKSMWGFPCLYMVGIALFYFWPTDWSETKQKAFIKTMLCWTVLFAVAYTAQCLLTKSERFRLNAPQLAEQLEQKWATHTDKPLEYVGADVWYANILALYGSHEIKPMIWLSPKNNPWFDAADFTQKGALVIANDAGEYAQYQHQLGAALSNPETLTVELKNYLGKTKQKQIYYGFYLNEENSREK